LPPLRVILQPLRVILPTKADQMQTFRPFGLLNFRQIHKIHVKKCLFNAFSGKFQKFFSAKGLLGTLLLHTN